MDSTDKKINNGSNQRKIRMSYTIKLTEEEVQVLHAFTLKAIEVYNHYPQFHFQADQLSMIKSIGSLKVKTEKLVNLINDDAN